MSAAVLYRALVDAGARQDLAKEAAESVVYSPEGVTKSDLTEARTLLETDIAEFRGELKGDIAGLRTELKGDIAELRTEFKGDIAELRTELKGDIADVRVCIAQLEARMERSLRIMTWRIVGLMIASQALLFAGLRLTGTS